MIRIGDQISFAAGGPTGPFDYAVAGARQRLGRRLAAIGRAAEDAFDSPQDLAGAIVGEEIYLVEARRNRD